MMRSNPRFPTEDDLAVFWHGFKELQLYASKIERANPDRRVKGPHWMQNLQAKTSQMR